MMFFQKSKRGKTTSQLIEIANNYNYISFDIFDTLICRNVSKPTDIFSYLELSGRKKYGSVINGFKEKRICAERKAREISDKEEITLEEIYDQLRNDYNIETVDWLIRKEIELELEFCAPNNDIIPFFEYCVNNNKYIILISDMYLHRNDIEKILHNCGFKTWKKIFVSSEYRATKSEGGLFTLALDFLDITPQRLMHVGDNYSSDYICARKLGVKGYHYIRRYTNLRYYVEEKMDEGISPIMVNSISSVEEKYRLGYECFGPLLYGFCQWLTTELIKAGINKVYFLSRDGLIIKKAFDILNTDGLFETEYFYASRKALRRPVISFRYSYIEFINRTKFSGSVSVRQFVDLFGLDDDAISDIEKKYDLSYYVDFSEIENNDTFQDLYSDLLRLVDTEIDEERDALVKYIQQKHMKGKFAVVDIGWHGNMQKDLEEIVSSVDSSEVYGYYIGVNPINNHKGSIKMSGFLFDNDKNIELFYEEKTINSLFELVFTAPHGSVMRYEKNDENIVVPVLCELEQGNASDVEALWNYQNGGLLFVRTISKYKSFISLSPMAASIRLLKQFEHPLLDDALLWKNLVFKDFSSRKLCYTGSFWNYMYSPSKLLSDYRKSVWKQGFLKIIFKKNFNYDRISKMITKYKHQR